MDVADSSDTPGWNSISIQAATVLYPRLWKNLACQLKMHFSQGTKLVIAPGYVFRTSWIVRADMNIGHHICGQCHLDRTHLVLLLPWLALPEWYGWSC